MPEQNEIEFEFKMSNAYLANLVRMNYLPWDALAEFIDNSVQSYLNNETDLKKKYKKKNEVLEIYITYKASNGILKVDDNAGGMNKELLKKCMELGNPDPNISKGLSQFNVGLKSAAIWMAKKYEIKTKHFSEKKEYTLSIDNVLLSSGNPEDNSKAVKTKVKDVDDDSSYTYLTFKDHHRKWQTSTITEIKRYLPSTYRKFIKAGFLKIFWNDTELEWQDFETQNWESTGKPVRYDFEWDESNINGVTLPAGRGFVAQLAYPANFPKGDRRRKRGSTRKNAGWSIFRRGRMIEGNPKAWRSEAIFLGGSNDRTNQRVYGELNFDDAIVSPEKADIDYDQKAAIDTELEKMEKSLWKLRDKTNDESAPITPKGDDEISDALDKKIDELEKSNKVETATLVAIPSEEVIDLGKADTLEKKKKDKAFKTVEVDGIKISLFYGKKYGPEKRYFEYESISANELHIIFNNRHPRIREVDYQQYLDEIINDALTFWKVDRKERVSTNTIMTVKDSLLRSKRIDKD